jgi:RHS repeat-associated protein
MRTKKTWTIVAAWAAALALAPAAAQADTKVRASSFEYDANGLLIKEVVEPDSPNDCLQTSYGYDGYGNKVSVSTSACAGASGHTVSSASTPRTASSTFSADGRFPVATSNALGQSETKVFDNRFGAVTSLTGPNGLTTTWEYDGFGRKTKETRADGTYTTWAYLLCTQTGANCPGPIGGAAAAWVAIEQSYAVGGATSAPEKRQFHDALNRVIRVQTAGFDGAGAAPTLVQDTEYDNLGRVARKSQVYALSGGNPNWTEYTYDAIGRVIQERSPDPAASGGYSTTTISYNGLTTVVTNSKGQTKTTTKNAQGQVAQVTDHAGNTVSYTYDALGQLTQTNAAGSITTITYNQRGHKVSMVDPAMGAWEYRYNAFGELVWQRDSLGQSSTIAYDVLGRMTQRSEPDLVSTWSYDKKFDGTACGKGVGKLCEAQADNGYKRTHSYDTLGRISTTATVLDNPSQPATVSVSYDAATGRLVNKTWPTGYQASYEYTALGYLKKVTGGGTNGFTQTVSYEVLTMDAQGHITQYRQGNQITTVKNFDGQTGRLLGITATRDGQATGAVQSHTYTYDSLGNLTSRADNSPGVGTSETFAYDALNRLSLYTTMGGGVSPPQSTEVLYDARGNILYKSDVGRYWYDPQRPNRLTNITLETAPGATLANRGTRALSYAFDDYKPGAQTINGITLGNGNLEYTVSQDTVNSRHTYRGETYTSFNMPKEITYGNFVNNAASTADRILSFVYGPEHQRIKQTVQLTSNNPTSYSAGTTWYLNGEDSLGLSYEKEIKANGTTEHKHYVSAGGVVFALYTSRTGATTNATVRYFHHDHLGSIAAITDEGGQVVERLAYDPWGKRRNINGVEDVLDSIVGWNTDRGFTMHEHLDEIGVIHMNGRVYDPLIGRFMSADPFIQALSELQSYNRYAYVMNNPLAFTDPTGYFRFKSIFKAQIKLFSEAATFHANPSLKNLFGFMGAQPGQKQVDAFVMKNQWAYAAGQYMATAFTAFCGGCGGMLYSAYYTYQATGSMNAVYKSAAISFVSSYVGAGLGGEGFLGQMIAGCVAGSLGGSGCKSGAISAAKSFAITHVITTGITLVRNADFGLPHLADDARQVPPTHEANKLIFLKRGDVNWDTAISAIPRDNEFLLIGHGNEGTQTMAGMTGTEMASYITKVTNWEPGQTIRVDACWLGKTPDGFAQQLANALNTRVIASPVRTIDWMGKSVPMHSWSISKTRALPYWKAEWKTFIPAAGAKE